MLLWVRPYSVTFAVSLLHRYKCVRKFQGAIYTGTDICHSGFSVFFSIPVILGSEICPHLVSSETDGQTCCQS
ncbi:unnamed protein product [Brugia timori]|uniref:Secreted protein n=1 Tax=Brugia timori TaxID=42155 RepID=A0A0R3QPN3_9BILA|nr:unnamed protein product [Brugia timori]